ncbi:SdrD B-like domain-containing protein [Cellulomonas sp. P4]|uniref:SdrD B-like domain-containing protein n=1 Tax=Cellulomonas sp. P4 TaxID=3142533 RepID=UPI0031BB478A
MENRQGAGRAGRWARRWSRGWARGWALGLTVVLALVAAVAGAPAAATAAGAPAAAEEPRAALSVVKSVVPTEARPGDRVTWTIDVTCESIVTMCVDAVLTDAVPAPFVIEPDGVSVQGQRTGSADVAVDGSEVRVAFRETDAGRPGAQGIAAGQSLSVLVQTTLPAGTDRSWDGASVVNTADAVAANADPVSDDATVTVVVPVDPAVGVTKRWTPSDQVAGDGADLTLALGVENRSPVAATALTLTDPAAGTAPAFGPGTPLDLRGFGDWTAPDGATGLTVELVTAAGNTTVGPFAPGTPVDTGAVDLAAVTGVVLRFKGDDAEALPPGAAGAVALRLGQNGTADRDAVTQVPNTAAGSVATAAGDATGTASATVQLNPVTVEVTAGKTVEGRAQAQVVAGAEAVVALSAANSSNTTLATLTVREPATGTDPFGTTADGKLELLGLGSDGTGTGAGADWPEGAVEAEVTFTGTGPGLPLTATVAAPADGSAGTVGWPQVPAGAVVTGVQVEYRGTMPPGARAVLPLRVATDAGWDTTRGFPNQVAVGGSASDGTVAAERTATATLTVVPRRVVTTTAKTLTQAVGGEQVTGAVGQEVVARLTGGISADTTVPVGRLVIEDVADGTAGSSLWGVAALDRLGSVAVPGGSQAEVLVRVGGAWTSLAGPTSDASALLDLAVPAGADGVRVVYTPLTAGASLPTTGSFRPVVTLVMALTEAQAPGTALTNTASTTGEGTGVGEGLTGTSGDTATTTPGPGGTPLDIRRVDASKQWRDAAALVPVGNATAEDGDRPANRLTMRVQNVTGIPVQTLRLVDPDPQVLANAFDLVDVTRLAVTAPEGTRDLTVVLRDADGTPLRTLTSAAAVAALTRAELADVAQVEARADGTLPDGAVLTVVADTELRATTRSGSPVLGTADGPAWTTVVNTLRGDLGPGTPDDAARADTVLYPEALQPLDGALAKSVDPGTVPRYAAEDRTVRLALSARRTSDAAVSRPWQYVLEDTTPEFWDAVDLVGLEALSGVTAADGTGFTAAVEYRVDGAWTPAVTSELAPGTAAASPALPAGAGDLPDGVDPSDVTGLRVTFTAPEGRWFANRVVGGFEGPTVLVTLAPRSTLRSTGAEVPAGTVTNVLTGSVQGEHTPSPVVLDPVTAPYTVTDGTPDATVTKSPVTTTTGPGAVIPFTLTATSTGTAPLVDPVLTDVLPADAEGALLVYDEQAYGAASVQVTPATAAAASATPTVTLDGTALRVTFPPGTRLLPGERVLVTVPLAVRPGVAAGTTLTNGFVLTAADDLRREATATVEVVAMATYLRVKDVAEDVAPGGRPTGVVSTVGGTCTDDGGFYRNPCLVRTAPGGTETWRMRVTNTGNLPTAAISLVDVLPHPGDTGTSRSQSGSPRGSVWAPEYLGDLHVEGVPAAGSSAVSYLLDGRTCRFTGDPRSADPAGDGCAADVWTPADQVDDLAAVRGLRVDVDLAAEPLQPGETVTVTFRTRSATGYDRAAADVDAPAWNTMVVSTASVAASGLVHETLEPNRAGVAVDRTYALGDLVWVDRDRDGRQGADEPGVPGVTVQVVPAGSDEPVATTVTGPDGRWHVDLLPAGEYRVRFVLDDATAARYVFTRSLVGDGAGDSDPGADGWTRVVRLGTDAPRVRPVVPADGLTADYVDPTVDAGLVERTVRVGDLVWVDTDGDGVQDPGEPGIPGVVLRLTGPDGSDVLDAFGRPVRPVTTDADGRYLFEDLLPGRYRVTVDRLASADALRPYAPTLEGAGSDRARDSSTWTADSSALTGGQEDLTLDFGFVPADESRLAVRKAVADRVAGRITWEVTVLSAGTRDVRDGFTVSDELEAGLRYVSATGDGFDCTVEGQVVTCRHDGPLAAGGTATVLVVTDVTTPGATVGNTAVVQPDDPHGTGVPPASDSAVSAAPAGELARTGSDAGWLLLGGLGALLLGALLVVSRRLRRE